jgi:hypothetical protein
MTRDQLLAELRDVLDDKLSPYQWSDQRLIGYLSEGQDKFCEDTGFFQDTVSYPLTLVSGTKSYALSPRIYQVLEVWNGTRKLSQFNQRQRDNSSFEFPLVPPLSSGPPYLWQTDEQTGQINFEPPPSEAGTLTLRVWRYAITALDSTQTLEIPSRFHRAPLEWAASKCYQHRGGETEDLKRAASHRAEYQTYALEGKGAWRRLANNYTGVGPNPVYNLGML